MAVFKALAAAAGKIAGTSRGTIGIKRKGQKTGFAKLVRPAAKAPIGKPGKAKRVEPIGKPGKAKRTGSPRVAKAGSNLAKRRGARKAFAASSGIKRGTRKFRQAFRRKAGKR